MYMCVYRTCIHVYMHTIIRVYVYTYVCTYVVQKWSCSYQYSYGSTGEWSRGQVRTGEGLEDFGTYTSIRNRTPSSKPLGSSKFINSTPFINSVLFRATKFLNCFSGVLHMDYTWLGCRVQGYRLSATKSA